MRIEPGAMAYESCDSTCLATGSTSAGDIHLLIIRAEYYLFYIVIGLFNKLRCKFYHSNKIGRVVTKSTRRVGAIFRGEMVYAWDFAFVYVVLGCGI